MRSLIPFLFFLLLFLTKPSYQQIECDANKICDVGCCSKAGHCGFGPEYCGDGCQSTCKRKSECNPGWPGTQWSNTTKCPLNVCCSKYGFCGTTELFCGNEKIQRPSCGVGSKNINRVIGYYEAWSMSERACNGMAPEEIPYGVYTHINFAFATIDPVSYEIKPGDSTTKSLMERISSIKLLQPDIKIWIAVGGWTFNDPWQPTAKIFGNIAASSSNQDKFISSLLKLMNTFGFDGVDIDWEYPGADDRSGRPEDFKNFGSFLKRLRSKLNENGNRKGISLTLPSSYWYLQHFDIVDLEEHVDWFNVMSYDIHGSWDIDNKWTGPFLNSHTNLTEIQSALDLLWRNKIHPEKVVLGLAFYSRSFTLTNPACSEPGCGISSGGNPGKCSGTTGVLLNPEIQDIIQQKKLTVRAYPKEAYKAVSWGNQWVSFDDEATWRIKSNLARSQCISGVMVWAISQDDKNSTNAKGLTKALGRTVKDMPDFAAQPSKQAPPKVVGLCRWSNCNENCPVGFKEVPRDGTNLMMTDETGCMGLAPHKFCCPGDYEQPKCRWRGFKNSGACSPGCNSGEVEVGTLSKGCSSKHQSACCDANAAVSPYGQCKWFGSADFCAGSGKHHDCDKEYPTFVFAASAGYGGDQICTQGAKSYCCKEKEPPAQFTQCEWFKKATHVAKADVVCETSCPEGYVRLAMHAGECRLGWEAYCCKGTPPPDLTPRDPNFGGTQVEEFKLLLQKYMQNPTCPALLLRPQLHDLYIDRPQKRSLVVEASEYSMLQKRARPSCSMDMWVRLLQFVTVMLSTRRSEMDPFVRTWNNEFAGYFDTALEADSLFRHLQDHPLIDHRALAENVLFDAIDAGAGLRRQRNVGSVICEWPQRRKREIRVINKALVDFRERDTNVTLKDRHVYVWENPTGGRSYLPSWETILDGINQGHLSLHYARWQYVTGRSSNAQPGPMLELAYWIGPRPGVDNGDAALDRYRDFTPRARGAAGDRFVVMHLHMNENLQMLRNINGHTYMGVQRITVFHGQNPRFQNGAWRVNNEDFGGLNSRDGWDCPEGDSGGQEWYIGSPRDNTGLSGPDLAFFTTLQTWAQNLYTAGYTGTAGQQLIFQGTANLPNGDIDPSVPPFLVRQGGQSNVAGGQDPYLLSWTVSDHGQGQRLYDFAPQPPPSL